MVMREFLLATEEGLGNGETPIFPISIFKLKSGISYNPEDPNYDLFKLSCRVSAKRLFPNILNLDAPYNAQYYVPGDIDTEVACMGCVERSELIRYRIGNDLYVEGIGRAFDRLACIGEVKEYGVTKYIDLENIGTDKVEIYDSNTGGFVKCKKILKNPDKHDWVRVKTSGGRALVATSDHPLPVVGKGRRFIKDIHVGDRLYLADKVHDDSGITPKFSKNIAWLLGVLLCDSSYANSIIISLGMDEGDIVNKIDDAVNELGGSIRVKEQHRGQKGDYLDISIRMGDKLKDLREWLTGMFGGKRKKDRQIPNEVFRWCAGYREAFIAGMMDADGYINHHRDRECSTSVACIGSINKELALQEFELLQSIGIDAKYYLNHYNSKDKDKIRYIVSFSAIDGIIDNMASTKKKEVFDSVAPSRLRVIKEVVIEGIERVEVGDYSYDVETESDRFDVSGIMSHNCRTRVMGNVYDPSYSKTPGRGNLSFTSINLPRLGIKAKGDIDKFFKSLDDMMELVHKQLIDRFKVQCRKHPRNYPFLMGQGIWHDTDKLGPDDDITEVLRHGTLTVGFIGLAECLKALIGVHHGESEEAQELGLKIIGRMRELTDKWSEEEKMNYSVIATPAEGLSGRFIRIDKKKFGIIPGVTDRDYYTNSFHKLIVA